VSSSAMVFPFSNPLRASWSPTPTSSAGEMPTSAERCAVDTSVAVAALDAGHAAHALCRHAVLTRRPGLAGHAAFETLSVLTRMPGPLTVDSPAASQIIVAVFPVVYWLDTAAVPALLTRDLRARRRYDLLGVDYEFIA
jgi:hypothetical protein